MVSRTSQCKARSTAGRLQPGVIAWALIAAFAFTPRPASAQAGIDPSGPETPDARVRSPKYPIGTAVNVHLKNHQTITGRVEKYGRDGFWVQAEGQDPRKRQRVFYFEMQSVSAARDGAGNSKGKGRFSLDFLMGGTGASVRVYTPQPKDEDASH